MGFSGPRPRYSSTKAAAVAASKVSRRSRFAPSGEHNGLPEAGSGHGDHAAPLEVVEIGPIIERRQQQPHQGARSR